MLLATTYRQRHLLAALYVFYLHSEHIYFYMFYIFYAKTLHTQNILQTKDFYFQLNYFNYSIYYLVKLR